MQWSRGRRIDILIVAIYVGSLVLLAMYNRQNVRAAEHRQIASICREVEKVKAQISESVRISDERLPKLGLGPKLVAEGHRQDVETIRRFAPKSCPKP